MVLGSAILASMLACALLTGLGNAHAAEDATPAEAQAANSPAEAKSDGLMSRDTLSGDWGGLRTDLRNAGVALGATETSETFGTVQGGVDNGIVYEGRLELDLDIDLEKMIGVADAVLHANAYQIHGRGPSANLLGGNLMTVSSIEAVRATRLFDLWVQKGFFDAALSIRLGQIAADDEFLTSQYAGALVNATFGWLAIMGVNLPLGGPAYPTATPGVRVKGALTNEFAIQAALFNGVPAGGANTPGQNASGADFSIGRSAFTIVELQYAPAVEGAATTPPSAYKLGAWYHSGIFQDPDRDRFGLSLADPHGSGLPRLHRGNFGVYATIDQLLYRKPETEDLGLSAFVRVSGTPGDRNLIAFYMDAGLSYKGLVEGRDDDLAALGVAYAQIGDQARRYDGDLARFGFGSPARDHEIAAELTYQIAVAPWWNIQPDFQYVLHPTTPVLSPAPASPARVGDLIVLGLRTSIRF